MTDETVKADEKLSKPWQFKKGFDERRWLKGRPKVPKDKLALFDNLVWEILSEEVEHPITKEKVDRLRLMLRSMTTNKNQQDKLLDRVFGKVQERVDVTSGGARIEPKVDNEKFDRALLTLTDALGEILSNKGTGKDSKVDTAK